MATSPTHLTLTSLQPQAFRLIFLASDLIRHARSVADANPRLIMLDTMPDEKDRSDQQIIVSACSVQVLIREEIKQTTTEPGMCMLYDMMYDMMFDERDEFDRFLSDLFVRSCFDVEYVIQYHRCRTIDYYDRVEYCCVCHHGSDWAARMACDSFVPRDASYDFDTFEWLAFVKSCNKQSASKLTSYKQRYFVRAYFFLALDCSIPVVEAVDFTLFHLSKA